MSLLSYNRGLYLLLLSWFLASRKRNSDLLAEEDTDDDSDADTETATPASKRARVADVEEDKETELEEVEGEEEDNDSENDALRQTLGSSIPGDDYGGINEGVDGFLGKLRYGIIS